MHKFLRSIGFGNVARFEGEERLIQDVLSRYDYKKIVENEDGSRFAEISKEYAPYCGVTVCGAYDNENLFHLEYYFPYLWGSQITNYDQIAVDRHSFRESFAAACDDLRVGTTLIFYLLNAGEYIETRRATGKQDLQRAAVSLSALADTGSVLLPVARAQKKAPQSAKDVQRRNNLWNSAQSGDEDAIESLTLEDIDTYSMLHRRIKREDVYSIVDTYFMPYGMECDIYNIMGEITDVQTLSNSLTGEKMYQLAVVSNDIPVDVIIGEADLLGEPEPGRRFKGTIWLQGRVQF